VEAALREHRLVEEAVVVVREGQTGEKRLVAYIVPSENSLQTDELVHWAATRIEPYARPSMFILQPQLPKDGKGRIDRCKLGRQPLPAVDSAPHTPPRNPIEECVATCWSELLNRQDPSIYDNFFDSGGHSLVGTQLVARLSQQFGVSIVPSQIFRGTDTIERLSAHIEILLLEAASPEDRNAVLAETSPLSDEQLEQMISAERPLPARAQ
jgi:nonribosomal peptide synthetase DhbF